MTLLITSQAMTIMIFNNCLDQSHFLYLYILSTIYFQLQEIIFYLINSRLAYCLFLNFHCSYSYVHLQYFLYDHELISKMLLLLLLIIVYDLNYELHHSLVLHCHLYLSYFLLIIHFLFLTPFSSFLNLESNHYSSHFQMIMPCFPFINLRFINPLFKRLLINFPLLSSFRLSPLFQININVLILIY